MIHMSAHGGGPVANADPVSRMETPHSEVAHGSALPSQPFQGPGRATARLDGFGCFAIFFPITHPDGVL